MNIPPALGSERPSADHRGLLAGHRRKDDFPATEDQHIRGVTPAPRTQPVCTKAFYTMQGALNRRRRLGFPAIQESAVPRSRGLTHRRGKLKVIPARTSFTVGSSLVRPLRNPKSKLRFSRTCQIAPISPEVVVSPPKSRSR